MAAAEVCIVPVQVMEAVVCLERPPLQVLDLSLQVLMIREAVCFHQQV